MLRGLLDSLEEGIECALGEHVDLVDDINLVCRSCRSEINFLKDRPDVVDTVIGRSIHLGNIKDGTVQDAFACRAFVAGVAVNGMLAVDTSCKDLGRAVRRKDKRERASLTLLTA